MGVYFKVIRLRCHNCGYERLASEILPPDECKCGHGWGGAESLVESPDKGK